MLKPTCLLGDVRTGEGKGHGAIRHVSEQGPIGNPVCVRSSCIVANSDRCGSAKRGVSYGEIPVPRGAKVTVTVSHVETARCEISSVSGVINETVFPQGVGGCGRGGFESDGLGLATMIGPAATTGTIAFRMTSIGGSVVSGSAPNYTRRERLGHLPHLLGAPAHSVPRGDDTERQTSRLSPHPYIGMRHEQPGVIGARKKVNAVPSAPPRPAFLRMSRLPSCGVVSGRPPGLEEV